VFLDEHTRELYADWPTKARAVVGALRLASGQHLDDPVPASLVGELSVRSREFASLWADHRVKSSGDAVYEVRHPLVGSLTVTQQSLRTEQDQHIVVGTTVVGSPSHAAMTLLVHSLDPQRTAEPARESRAEPGGAHRPRRHLHHAARRRRDGLQNPTSVAVRDNTAHVFSAACTTATDPNLLLAKLSCR
jgi:hypothetical protein